MRPLIYLELRVLINSLKNTLRSPKRLIPTLIIGAWVLSWFVQSILFLSGDNPLRGPSGSAIPADLPIEVIRLIVFLGLSIGSLAVMYGAFSSGLLVFSIAQIDFLFPTPISRRKVLVVKLLKDYLKYGFWVVFFYLFIGTPVLSHVQRSLFPLGLVSVAALVALLLLVVNTAHTINIVFTFGYERLRQAGIIIKAILVGIPASALGYGIYQYVTTGDSYASLLLAVNSPIANVLFAPARWCSELFLAPLIGVTSEEWSHFGLLWLLAAASLVVLLTRKENVYEPSLGISARVARRKQMMGSRTYTDLRIEALREKGTRQAGGFAIPAFGTGAVAFLWKNLVLRYRVYRRQLIFIVLLPLIVVYLIRRFLPNDEEIVRHVPLLMVYLVWLLSMTAQAEIRADLKFANMVKAMPIAAWKVVLAQAASPVIYMSSAIMLFSAYLWALVPGSRGDLLTACAFSAPFIGFANISAAIIPGLLYPDAKDVAQNYMCGLFGFLLATLAMAPTVVLGAGLMFVLKAPVYVTIAVVAAANTILGMAGISIAGAIFRKFDPTSE